MSNFRLHNYDSVFKRYNFPFKLFFLNLIVITRAFFNRRLFHARLMRVSRELRPPSTKITRLQSMQAEARATLKEGLGYAFLFPGPFQASS